MKKLGCPNPQSLMDNLSLETLFQLNFPCGVIMRMKWGGGEKKKSLVIT